MAADAAGGAALLEETCLVDHQDRIDVSKMLHDMLAHDVAQRVGIPLSTAKQRLLSPGAIIAGRLRTHPARLARLAAEQCIQELPRRDRNTILREQWTDAPPCVG